MSLQENVSAALDVVIPSIRQRLHAKKAPVILGVTGIQGAGKSTWASAIVDQLCTQHRLRAIQVSLDDFYFPHETLVEIRTAEPGNALLRTRGEPGTHDEQLAQTFFADLQRGGDVVDIPAFDKSAFNGEGDRLSRSEWPRFHGQVDVVVFEGWCVGFVPLLSQEIKQRRQAAMYTSEEHLAALRSGTLALHGLHHLDQLNTALGRYCEGFMGPQHLDLLIQLDTVCLENVYRWRLEQEHAMVGRGSDGMTDSAVLAFIQSYMPAYELYLDGLRKGFFKLENAKKSLQKPQLRILLDQNRELVDMILLN